ncbi:MAG TPA: hypothetical protein VJN96_25430 [Vicinamibacterales bacterium]|nr:hypothetical protein [Vicinamibacterales bacterium]
MRVVARVVAVGIVIALGGAVRAGQETKADYQGPAAEEFLTKAKVIASKELGEGITRPLKLTMELNGKNHFAVYKNIDERKFGVFNFPDGTSEVNYQDSWQTEIAAYRLDLMIGLGMVPATVERKVNGSEGSVQWFVESMMPESERIEKKLQPPDVEAWNRQGLNARLFDELIANVDRHLNNLLVTRDWEIRLIDHSRSFRTRQTLDHPEKLTRFSRSLLDAIRKLDEKSLKQRMGRYLDGTQVDRLLKRRDLIVKLADKMVKEKGEAAVLY